MHHNFKLDLSKCVNEDEGDFMMSEAVEKINQTGNKKDKKKKVTANPSNQMPPVKVVAATVDTPTNEESEPIELDQVFIEDVSTSNRLQMIPSSRRAKMLKQKGSVATEPSQQPEKAADKSIRIISRDGNGQMSPKIAKKTLKKLE